MMSFDSKLVRYLMAGVCDLGQHLLLSRFMSRPSFCCSFIASFIGNMQAAWRFCCRPLYNCTHGVCSLLHHPAELQNAKVRPGLCGVPGLCHLQDWH